MRFMGIRMERDIISSSSSSQLIKHNKLISRKVHPSQPSTTTTQETTELNILPCDTSILQNYNIHSSECQTDDDVLPSYECTLQREGQVYVKQERDEHSVVNTGRQWDKVYLRIQGTKVTLDYGTTSRWRPTIFSTTTRSPPNYIRTLPIENARLISATEHCASKSYTFRMILSTREHLLIRTDSATAATQWAESLRAAINISPDIDNRKEIQFKLPKAIYYPY